MIHDLIECIKVQNNKGVWVPILLNPTSKWKLVINEYNQTILFIQHKKFNLFPVWVPEYQIHLIPRYLAPKSRGQKAIRTYISISKCKSNISSENHKYALSYGNKCKKQLNPTGRYKIKVTLENNISYYFNSTLYVEHKTIFGFTRWISEHDICYSVKQKPREIIFDCNS